MHKNLKVALGLGLATVAGVLAYKNREEIKTQSTKALEKTKETATDVSEKAKLKAEVVKLKAKDLKEKTKLMVDEMTSECTCEDCPCDKVEDCREHCDCDCCK